MKSILIAIFLLITSFALAQSNELIQLRETCFKAFLENNPAEFINKVNQLNKNNNPVITAYKSLALILKARNAFSPIDKIKYFNRGKNLLENSIYSDNSSLEIRFLRFCVQTSLPFFLGYSDNISNDKNFILNNWIYSDDLDLKERIRVCMLKSEHCNDFEKKKFSNG